MSEVDFQAWPKIQRLDKNFVTITEKIDGTNACVIIQDRKLVGCQSRNRLITPDNDNMGFAGWAYENQEPLSTLGDGYHYGEWAGPGIQKNPHDLTEKTFFLFDPRWSEAFQQNSQHPAAEVLTVVPELYVGTYTTETVETIIGELIVGNIGVGAGRETNPEGIILYFHVFRQHLKRHIEGRK